MMTQMNNYQSQAEMAARVIPRVLSNRGLEPSISRYALTERDGLTWLFAIIDESAIPKIERYIARDTIHQLSTALGGLPVIISNSTGLRYAVLLSQKPEIGHNEPFPGWSKGVVKVGISPRGEVTTTWPEMGHALVAGVTRFGKSNFLRLVAIQAIHEGHNLVVVDPDGSTFPDLNGHRQVKAYAPSPAQAPDAIGYVWSEFGRRQKENYRARQRGEQWPEWPRLLVVVDEYNGLVQRHGGPKSQFARTLIDLAYGGLKFGIQLILAGHEFTKDLVGPIAGQMVTRVCFRVMRPSISQVVVHGRGAELIKRPGRAITDPWGLVQVYRMDFDTFDQEIGHSSQTGLSSKERQIAQHVLDTSGGRLTFGTLMAFGMTRAQARELREDWVRRGLARRAPAENNSIVLDNFTIMNLSHPADGRKQEKSEAVENSSNPPENQVASQDMIE